MSTLSKSIKIFSIALLVALNSVAFAAAKINVDANDIAIQGYDPVAYFTDSKATKGKAKFSAIHDAAIYHFASEKNRDAFKASPDQYAPQYGGFCAFGVSKQRKFSADPEAWRVVDGKLYLNLNKNVQKIWLEDVPGNIETAEQIWPEIQNSSDKFLEEISS